MSGVIMSLLGVIGFLISFAWGVSEELDLLNHKINKLESKLDYVLQDDVK